MEAFVATVFVIGLHMVFIGGSIFGHVVVFGQKKNLTQSGHLIMYRSGLTADVGIFLMISTYKTWQYP